MEENENPVNGKYFNLAADIGLNGPTHNEYRTELLFVPPKK